MRGGVSGGVRHLMRFVPGNVNHLYPATVLLLVPHSLNDLEYKKKKRKKRRRQESH